jgi:hypothetical protein
MSEFATFIANMPGLTDCARRHYLLIDRQAIGVGRRLAATHKSTALRARVGSPWMMAECHGLAESLDTDARLAAIKSLRAWATRPEGIGNTWINWYVALLKAHISEKKERPKAKSDTDRH